jgi:hypothetical protein
MMTGVGTLLAALVALASFLVSQQFFSDSPSDGDPDQPAATDVEGKRLDEKVLWEPQTILLATSDFDDADGPVRGSEYPNTDMYLSFTDNTISAPFGMAKWVGTNKPTQNDCAKRIASHGTSKDLVYEPGDRFCLKTNLARIAMIEILRETGEGMEIEATAWKQRLTVE